MLSRVIQRRMAQARSGLFGPSRLEAENERLRAKLAQAEYDAAQLYTAATIACRRYRQQIARLEAELSAALEASHAA